MKINFNQNLLDFSGEPIWKESPTDDKAGIPWTLREAALTSLKVALSGDEAMAPLEKVQLGLIGVAIIKGTEVTTGDAEKLKARICKILPAPMVAWAVDNAIEGKEDAATPTS